MSAPPEEEGNLNATEGHNLNLLKYHPDICHNAKSVISEFSNLKQSF